MRTRGWPRFVVMWLAAVHVTGLVLDRPLLPGSGSLTLAAILAFAVGTPPSPSAGQRRWPRRALLAGLAALAATAALIDGRSPGIGWPLAAASWPAENAVWAAAESLLLVCAAAGLAGALLAVAGRPRSRRALAAVVAPAALTAVVCGLAWWGEYDDRPWRPAVFEARELVTATLPFVFVAVLGALAIGAAWAAGRSARATGAALAPLVWLALAAFTRICERRDFYRELPDDGTGPDARFALARLDHIVSSRATVVPSGPPLATGWPLPAPAKAARPPEPDVPSFWPDDFWAADISWAALRPAVAGLLCLIGVMALVGTLAGDAPDEL